MEVQEAVEQEITPEVVTEAPEVIEPPKELSLREELEGTMKDVKERQEERARDEKGKFAKKEEKPAAEKTVEKAASEEPKEAPKTQISPPHTWTANAKAKWNELPPDIQAEVAKREAEVEKGFTRLDEERQVGKSFKEVIAPYMPIIQAEGGTPITAVQSLLNSAYILRTASPQQKGQLLLQLAQQYGADMSQVSQGQQPTIDPNLRAIQQELAQIKGERQSELSMRKQQEQAAIQSQIEAFAADPKHVHFPVVKPYMAALLRDGLATDMQDAYDKAVYANPDIRSTLIQAQEADKEAKRVADARAKADAARKASVSITGSPGATAPKGGNGKEMTLREELEAQFAAARNG